MLDRAEPRLCCGFGLTPEFLFQIIEDHRLRFGDLARLGKFLDHLGLLFREGDACTGQRGEFRHGIAQRLSQLHRCRSQIHLQRCGKVESQRLRALEVLAGDVGKGKQPGSRFIEDRLVAEDRLSLQFGSIVGQLPKIVSDGLIRRLKGLPYLRFGLRLYVGQVERYSAQRRKGSRHLQRQLLTDRRELLRQRAEALLDLLRFLLELITVSSDLDQQIGDAA